jgi:hypothetical protein
MTCDPHEANSISQSRRATRRIHSRFDRSWGHGFLTVRVRHLVVLATAVSSLIAMTGPGASAAPYGKRALGGGVLRAFSVSKNLPSSSWNDLVHHHHHHHPPGWSPPPVTTTTTTTTTTPVTNPPGDTPYPYGIVDASEPSGVAPPAADAMAGYTQSYVSDFSGSSLPNGWSPFSGQPGGDPGAQWSPAHVTVSSGMLQLNTWQDPAYGNRWVAGGLCQCGVSNTYAAYFIRSRTTGPGPTVVQLLWPDAHVWPPEVDFNETDGTTVHTSATLHWASANLQDQRRTRIDMTAWHTWGVIWTPNAIIYTVDGEEWGSVKVASEIPNQAMTLDLTQQTWCASGFACPSSPQSMQVDWVAEYTPS